MITGRVLPRLLVYLALDLQGEATVLGALAESGRWLCRGTKVGIQLPDQPVVK